MGIISMKKPALTYCNYFLQIFPSSFPIINCKGKNLYTRAIIALNSFSLSLFLILSLLLRISVKNNTIFFNKFAVDQKRTTQIYLLKRTSGSYRDLGYVSL